MERYPAETLPIFKFGIGLFESMRIEKNVALDLEQHLQRLKDACDHFKFGKIILDDVRKEFLTQCAQLDSEKIYRSRIWITPPISWVNKPQSKSENVIWGTEIDEFIPTSSQNLKLLAVGDTRPIEFRYFKTTQYFLPFLKKKTAQADGFDDILFVDEHSQFPHESSTSGFIWRTADGSYCTCQPENACLPSISILNYLGDRKKEGATIRYIKTGKMDWNNVTNCYLVSSIQGLREVDSVFPFWKKVPQN